MIEEHIILVDTEDNPVGFEEKIRAHELGLCHRAFSVFIIRPLVDSWQVLLQQRHPNKYHSGGLWTNTCCSHPRKGESIVQAGERRLYEEMGIKNTLKAIGKFHYVAKFDNGLTENEVDTVLVGEFEEQPIQPVPHEAMDYGWFSLDEIDKDFETSPSMFTAWFKEAYDILKKYLTTN